MSYFFNWNLAKHPSNWITVLIMVWLGMLVFHFAASYVTNSNNTGS